MYVYMYVCLYIYIYIYYITTSKLNGLERPANPNIFSLCTNIRPELLHSLASCNVQANLYPRPSLCTFRFWGREKVDSPLFSWCLETVTFSDGNIAWQSAARALRLKSSVVNHQNKEWTKTVHALPVLVGTENFLRQQVVVLSTTPCCEVGSTQIRPASSPAWVAGSCCGSAASSPAVPRPCCSYPVARVLPRCTRTSHAWKGLRGTMWNWSVVNKRMCCCTRV